MISGVCADINNIWWPVCLQIEVTCYIGCFGNKRMKLAISERCLPRYLIDQACNLLISGVM